MTDISKNRERFKKEKNKKTLKKSRLSHGRDFFLFDRQTSLRERITDFAACVAWCYCILIVGKERRAKNRVVQNFQKSHAVFCSPSGLVLLQELAQCKE